jgi:putative DNA primase/helicase
MIPFTVSIPPEEQDRTLFEKLLTELPGILNWALQGCVHWQREGLDLPLEVKTAIATYRAEMDTLADFSRNVASLSLMRRSARERSIRAIPSGVRRTGSDRSGKKPLACGSPSAVSSG